VKAATLRWRQEWQSQHTAALTKVNLNGALATLLFLFQEKVHRLQWDDATAAETKSWCISTQKEIAPLCAMRA
jgi:hypothetical protein